MANILLDQFTDTNGVSIANHTPNASPLTGWQQTATTSFQIENNTLQPNRNSNGDLAVIDVGVSDFNLSVDTIPLVNTSSNVAYAGLVFRYQDSSNFWYVYTDIPNKNINLFKIIAGVSTQVARYPVPTTLVSGQTIKLGINCIADMITLWVDGVEINTYIDSQFQGAHLVGVRNGRIGDGSVLPTWDNITLTPFNGVYLNWPRFTEYAGNPIASLGDVGSWEAADLNDANVIFDPVQQVYTLLYSGYSGSGGFQGLGVARATSILGTYVKDANNPVFAGNLIQNGGAVYFNDKWFYYYGNGASTQIGCATGKTLNNLTDQGIVLNHGATGEWDGSGVFDAYARITQDGRTIQLWYCGQDPNHVRGINYAVSRDGINFTKISSSPLFGLAYWPLGIHIDGEPSVFVPPGKEGVEMLVGFDTSPGFGANNNRRISGAITLDGGNTWHFLDSMLPSSGNGWESLQVFDSFFLYIGTTLYLFHSGGNLPGGALNLNSELGVASTAFSYFTFDANKNSKQPYSVKKLEKF